MPTNHNPNITPEQELQNLKEARQSVKQAKKDTLKYIEKTLNMMCEESS